VKVWTDIEKTLCSLRY